MVEILNGLTGGAFAEIVETGDQDQALAGFIQGKTNVTEVGVGDVLQLGQSARGPDADHGPASVKLAIEGFQDLGRLPDGERDVDGRENSARHRQEVRRKNELRFGEAGVLENFRRVAVREKIVGLEILVHFNELQIATWIFACAAGARLAVADDALVRGDETGFSERT